MNTAAVVWLLALSGLMAAAAIERAIAERRELRRRNRCTCTAGCTTTTNLRAARIPAQRTDSGENRS